MKTATVTEPALLIRINRLYHSDMTDEQLYEATRGIWRLGKRREKAKFAFAIFRGEVLQVYQIDTWHEAGTTPYPTRKDVNKKDRWEFLGKQAPALTKKYQGRSVAAQLTGRFPVNYVNC
jgi:hypothetical protein